MHNLYLATTFAGALVCFLAFLLLFSRRKEEKRSRTILAFIVLFSVVNYIPRFIALCNGKEPDVVVSAPLMLVGIFMIISYIMYPIEVISPGWINLKRLVKLYLPLIVLSGIYFISIKAGVKYTTYHSLWQMLPHANRFEIWFRLLLSLIIFLTIFFIYFIPYVRSYNNTTNIWIRKYVNTISINILAYFLVLAFDNFIIHTLYYYVSVGCSLFIVYMDLFVRLIGNSSPMTTELKHAIETHEEVGNTSEVPSFEEKSSLKSKNEILIEQLDSYMQETRAWRDPDLSLNALASALCTNRTTLTQIIQEIGYKNYTLYINSLRINDFIQMIDSEQSTNFQEAFFDAGFRSRATALRNFRQITGKIPSEYFQIKND